ncbi:hypothetical protein N803_10050 [Knoellia subterranea KCTC 19937]|uniref:Peptidase C60 n=1 Tax=Knoellia subterranea KCTC 19937 TaxID=1385521 RepID=A0A0A0JNJ0_9MICO|nr:hypothetical protein N803_10050 [Knoellia subterranea KCTC 19937]
MGPSGSAHFVRPGTLLVAGLSCLVLAAVLTLVQSTDEGVPAAAAPTATPAAPARTPSPAIPTTATATATVSPSVTPTRSTTATRSASPSTTRTPKPSRTAPSRAPMSMSVPAIDVSGRLRRIAAVNGVVNPPSGTLAWVSGYNRVRPGEIGTAVVAGHVVHGKSPDVFYHLQNIDRGDRITVWDSDGKPVVYTVTKTRVANKTEVSRDSAVWGANSSVRRLALITCDDDEGFRADGHRVANFVAIAEAR